MMAVCAGEGGVCAGAGPAAAQDSDRTAVPCFTHMQAPEGARSQLSNMLQVPAPNGSAVLTSTPSRDVGAMAPYADAVMGGLSVRPSSPKLPASVSPVHGQQPLSGEALRRLSESLPQQVQMSASPDAFGDSSWHHVGLQLAGMFCQVLAA